VGRFEQELMNLTEIIDDEAQPVTLRTIAVLTSHQRADVGSCICGWTKLGRSHAGHQTEKLREAGLLRD
jgi:hypothetical protein